MGGDGRKNTQEARRTESRSMEETTKERNPELRPRRIDRRHDHKESYTDMIPQQQRLISHETELKSLLRKKKMEANHDRERSELKTISDERIPSSYPLRPGEKNCRSYVHSGHCLYGSNCRFNHPRCKFFLRGACKEGSACIYLHAKDSDVPRLPMRQASSSNDRDGVEPMRQGSRRHETEPAYWQEEKETKDWVFNIEKKYNRSLSQICDGIVVGYNREKMVKRQRDNTEWQRREAQEKEQKQKHRQRETNGRQRDVEKEKSEAQKNVQKHRQRETNGWQRDVEKEKSEAQKNVKKHRQRETNGWQRDVEKEKSEAQENVKKQRLMEIPEKHKVDALQVERNRERALSGRHEKLKRLKGESLKRFLRNKE